MDNVHARECSRDAALFFFFLHILFVAWGRRKLVTFIVTPERERGGGNNACEELHMGEFS